VSGEGTENGELGTLRRAAAAVAQSSPLETQTAHSSGTGLGRTTRTRERARACGGKGRAGQEARRVKPQRFRATNLYAFMNGAQRYSAQCTFYKQPVSPRMEDGVFIKLVLSLDAKQKIQI
jgi:hypothetical protein